MQSLISTTDDNLFNVRARLLSVRILCYLCVYCCQCVLDVMDTGCLAQLLNHEAAKELGKWGHFCSARQTRLWSQQTVAARSASFRLAESVDHIITHRLQATLQLTPNQQPSQSTQAADSPGCHIAAAIPSLCARRRPKWSAASRQRWHRGSQVHSPC